MNLSISRGAKIKRRARGVDAEQSRFRRLLHRTFPTGYVYETPKIVHSGVVHAVRRAEGVDERNAWWVARSMQPPQNSMRRAGGDGVESVEKVEMQPRHLLAIRPRGRFQCASHRRSLRIVNTAVSRTQSLARSMASETRWHESQRHG